MDTKYFNLIESGDVATVEIFPSTRGGRFNKDAILEISRLFEYLDDHSDFRFVILKGAEGTFSEGLECNLFDGNKRIDINGFNQWESVIRNLQNIRKITVAVVDGLCAGAAIQLILACDMRIVSQRSSFLHGEMEDGHLPGNLIMQLGKYCGLGRALELVQSGKAYTAEQAQTLGIINECHAPAELDAAVDAKIVSYKNTNLEMHFLARRLLRESYEMSHEDFIGCYLAAQHRALSLENKQEKQRENLAC